MEEFWTKRICCVCSIASFLFYLSHNYCFKMNQNEAKSQSIYVSVMLNFNKTEKIACTTQRLKKKDSSNALTCIRVSPKRNNINAQAHVKVKTRKMKQTTDVFFLSACIEYDVMNSLLLYIYNFNVL